MLLLNPMLLLYACLPSLVSARLMATLPQNSVLGVSVELHVTEDLFAPDSPIQYASADGAVKFTVTKNRAQPQVSNASWGAELSPPVGLSAVLGESADLLGNAMLKEKVADRADGYDTIAGLAPPVLANVAKADDYDLTQGTFIGNRISAQKHSFDHTGQMNKCALTGYCSCSCRLCFSCVLTSLSPVST